MAVEPAHLSWDFTDLVQSVQVDISLTWTEGYFRAGMISLLVK